MAQAADPLERIRDVLAGTEWAGRVWLVGGAVREELLGQPASADLDLVVEGDALAVARLLYAAGVADHPPAVYPRFGTAMIQFGGRTVEFASARSESYAPDSRKPEVRPATLEQDALRRDFTVNTLMRRLDSGEIYDATGLGIADLRQRILRTPRDPATTFIDDPLRMLRAVRFRWKLGLTPAPGVYEAVREHCARLAVISSERIQEELTKMLALPDADQCLRDLQRLGLTAVFAPEFDAMVGVEQGRYHHLDVWEHSLLVLKMAGNDDPILSLAALFHDIGKPPTRTIDESGNTRFFGHETVGAELTRRVMTRLHYPNRTIDSVTRLVKNHMRLGSSKTFSRAAARRVLRDLGEDTERLLSLVEADTKGLKAGVLAMDLQTIREKIAAVRVESPSAKFDSPLSGEEIMATLGMPPGPEVGKAKQWLCEKVLDGVLGVDDHATARRLLTTEYRISR